MPLSIRPLRSNLSLRSLRAAFGHSSSSSTSSSSPTMSESHAMCPSAMMMVDSHPNACHPAEPRLSSQSDASMSFESASAAPLPRRVIRTKKSMLQLEQEEERMYVDDALVALVEPRPASLMPTLGGIEEVIEGRI